jgi:hypothetical protein
LGSFVPASPSESSFAHHRIAGAEIERDRERVRVDAPHGDRMSSLSAAGDDIDHAAALRGGWIEGERDVNRLRRRGGRRAWHRFMAGHWRMIGRQVRPVRRGLLHRREDLAEALLFLRMLRDGGLDRGDGLLLPAGA